MFTSADGQDTTLLAGPSGADRATVELKWSIIKESTCLTSDYTTKPQSSRQYGTGTKTEIQINGTE